MLKIYLIKYWEEEDGYNKDISLLLEFLGKKVKIDKWKVFYKVGNYGK